jgi:hypothetical protein
MEAHQRLWVEVVVLDIMDQLVDMGLLDPIRLPIQHRSQASLPV